MNNPSLCRSRLCFSGPIFLVFVIPLLGGCENSSKYQLAPVSGIVTLNGEPLSEGVVNFQPMMAGDSANVGAGSTARTDAKGHFVLNTTEDQPGAIVGKHRVRIYSFSPESPRVEDTDSGPPSERIPHRYNYRSKLTHVVTAEGTSEANFDLSSQKRKP